MNFRISRKFAFSAAAIALVFGVSAPASAGGYYGGYGYGSHYYGGHYYGGYRHGGHYKHRRHYRHRGHHGGGGKAAAIALGVIGGAIILNEVAENRAERRAYERRYDRRYDRYSTRAAPPPPERDYLPERDYDGSESDAGYDNGDIDRQLEGRNDGGPEPIRLSYADAYDACMKHARSALSNRGFVLAAPARPETAEDVGGAWKMTANVTAENQSGESWNRAMYCEADDSRVYLLELI